MGDRDLTDAMESGMTSEELHYIGRVLHRFENVCQLVGRDY